MCTGEKKKKKIGTRSVERKLNKTNAWVERAALSSVSGASVKGFAHV